MIYLTIGFIGCVLLMCVLWHRLRVHETAIAELLMLHPELLASEEENE